MNAKAPAVSRLRRTLYVAIPIVSVIATIVACGSDRLGAAGDGTNPGSADRCATPNDGCDCLEPGLLVECGQVKATSTDGFVACSMGHRQCLGGKWGVCVGEQDVVKPRTFTAGGGLSTRALGAGGPCGTDAGGPANPCDPYCNGFVDDPIGLILDGGLIVTPDGGLTVGPPDAGDGGAGGGFQSTPGGVSACGGAINIVGPACTPPGLTTCQQDFRCNPITNTCLWNGGPGYFDPTAGGVDLTVGAPCGPSGSGYATAPVCNRGSTTLAAGATLNFHVTAPPTPPDSCTNLGPPSISVALGAPLAPGECTYVNLGNSTGNKFITINAGAPGAVVEAPGRCANNSAAFKDDGAPGCGTCTGCNTTITGKVFDPSGAGPGTNNLPLPGIEVFEPAGALLPLVDGVTCDSCASLKSPAQTATVTNASGSFTLTNVSPGTAVPITVQSGRWRRTVSVNVNACVPNTYPAGTFRFPQSAAEGNIPKLAIVTGNQESLACLMRKIGIVAGEVGGSSGAADPKRIQMFTYNGMTTTAPVAPAVSTLWNAATLNRYTAVIGDCPGTNDMTPTAAERTAVRTYVDAGGRLFVDHWAGAYMLPSAEFPTVATWNNAGGPTTPAKGRINSATPPEKLLSDWLADPTVLGSTDYGAGWIRVDEARSNARIPAAGVYKWISGQMTNSWGAGAPPGAPTNPSDYALSFSFDTPFPGGTCGGSGGTGRVIYNDMHVNPSRGATGGFPGACNLGLALAPEEKALIFQLFQLTACQIGGALPPPPPVPPPALTIVNYERTYRGVCGPGERVKWGPFYWEAAIPPGTNIKFRGATADTIAALPGSPPLLAPTTANVGTASSTVLAPTWDCTGCPAAPVSVESQLLADTGVLSKEYLRIFMQFTPTATVPPTLTSWRQIYDCVPAE